MENPLIKSLGRRIKPIQNCHPSVSILRAVWWYRCSLLHLHTCVSGALSEAPTTIRVARHSLIKSSARLRYTSVHSARKASGGVGSARQNRWLKL
jgi:hypothetical protein